MSQGEVYPITVLLTPTSNFFKAGHRIRVDISSSNFPRFDINPNTGEPMGRHTHTQSTRKTPSTSTGTTRPTSYCRWSLLPREVNYENLDTAPPIVRTASRRSTRCSGLRRSKSAWRATVQQCCARRP